MRLHSLRLFVDGRVRLVLLLAVVILAVESFASNVSVSTTTFQAQYGLVFDVISSFTALDQGFSNVTVSKIASSQPCLWVAGTTCNTALTSPHLQYSIALTLKTRPLLLTTYTITVRWTQAGGSSTQMGQLTVSVSALASSGQQMTFQFDTGTGSFTSLLSIDVTVS